MNKQGSILIVSATAKEIEKTRSWALQKELAVDFCITGPGIPATVFGLTKVLLKAAYDLVINAGIAGALNDRIQLCEVVEVAQDSFADLGAEDDNQFIHISGLGFEFRQPAFNNKFFPVSAYTSFNSMLKKVTAITVNKVHGNELSIHQIKEYFHADIETMEGAAAAYVCSELNVPFMQIRSISNRVEKRDKSKWETEKAIHSLNDELIRLIQDYFSKV
jgi:futalosine hydrolase